MIKLSHVYFTIFVLSVYGFSYSDTHYVSLDGTNDSAGGYTDWVGAATQIQWAVDAAVDGETVLVSNGIYYLTNQISITNSSITLKSFSGSYTNTVINGNYPTYINIRGVYIANTGAVLDGFTITNCFITNAWGAGFAASPSFKLITNCLITGNIATQTSDCAGGYAVSGTISHCSFIGNKVAGSGSHKGLVATYSIVSNCFFSKNEYQATGGDYGTYWGMYGGKSTGVNCMISGNIGLGVRIDSGNCLFSCIVSNNTGSGINMISGIVRNCLVVQNGSYGVSIGQWGGGDRKIDNCTIANNGDRGVYIYWEISSGAKYIANSIIYHNKNGNWGYAGTNIVYTNCCIIPIPTNIPGQPEGTGNITNTPLFANTNIGNYRLSANSPCVNTGTNRSWLTSIFDLDGNQRIRYGIVDMGAYERIYEGTVYKFH